MTGAKEYKNVIARSVAMKQSHLLFSDLIGESMVFFVGAQYLVPSIMILQYAKVEVSV